jgi:hypothetical protein
MPVPTRMQVSLAHASETRNSPEASTSSARDERHAWAEEERPGCSGSCSLPVKCATVSSLARSRVAALTRLPTRDTHYAEVQFDSPLRIEPKTPRLLGVVRETRFSGTRRDARNGPKSPANRLIAGRTGCAAIPVVSGGSCWLKDVAASPRPFRPGWRGHSRVHPTASSRPLRGLRQTVKAHRPLTAIVAPERMGALLRGTSSSLPSPSLLLPLDTCSTRVEPASPTLQRSAPTAVPASIRSGRC